MQKKGESQRTWGLPPQDPRKFDVVGLGENSVDLIATVSHWPQPDSKCEMQSLARLPGGQAATAMVACARLGCHVAYLGAVGEDRDGELVLQTLRDEAVDVSHCRVARAATRRAIVVADAGTGTRTVLWDRDSALDWPEGRVPTEAVAQAKVLYVDATDMAAALTASTHAGRMGVPVLADVERPHDGLDTLLRMVDVLVVAEDFPAAYTGRRELGEAMRRLHHEYQPSLVVATLGAAGALAWDGVQEVFSPGFVVPVVDSTGAGDAFRGGLLAAWVCRGSERPPSLEQLLDFANATGALNCRAVGAQRGLPTRDEVLALLTRGRAERSNQAGRISRTTCS